MKIIRTCTLFVAISFLSACANQFPQTHNNAPATPKQSNADMAENFSNAVQRCVGLGLTVGSALYDTCVKNQLK